MGIKWTTALETGVRQIDLQHQELVELINEAAAAHTAGNDQQTLQEVMPRLAAYVLFHFGTEEALLAGPGISSQHAAAHRSAHRAFTTRIEELKQSALGGDATALASLLDYLQSWLLDHIMVTDKALARQLLTEQHRN